MTVKMGTAKKPRREKKVLKMIEKAATPRNEEIAKLIEKQSAPSEFVDVTVRLPRDLVEHIREDVNEQHRLGIESASFSSELAVAASGWYGL